MDIAQAKQELRRTIRAYTAKTEDGVYRMPRRMQRPVLLMGPPGIGKTAILSQLAQEEHIGLAAYTMTHHTRQSALGLPVIVGRTAAGKTFRATEYTMSEIIASVYEQMEKTGLRGDPVPRRDQLRVRDAHASDPADAAEQDLWRTQSAGGLAHRGRGQPAALQPVGPKLRHGDARPRALHRARAESRCLAALRCRRRRASGRAELSAAAPGALFPLQRERRGRGVRHGPRLGGAFCAFARLRGAGLSLHACADAAISARAGGGCRLRRVLRAVPALCRTASARRNSDRHRVPGGRKRCASCRSMGGCPSWSSCCTACRRSRPPCSRTRTLPSARPALQAASRPARTRSPARRSCCRSGVRPWPCGKDCGVLPPEEERREAAFLSRAEAALAPARTDAEASAALQKLAADAAASPRRRAAKRPAARVKTACGLSRTRSARTRSSGSCSTVCSTPAPPKPCRKTPPPSAPASSPKPPRRPSRHPPHRTAAAIK